MSTTHELVDDEDDDHKPKPAPPFDPANVPVNSIWQWRDTIRLQENARKATRPYHKGPRHDTTEL